jgi:hypothetical protein
MAPVYQKIDRCQSYDKNRKVAYGQFKDYQGAEDQYRIKHYQCAKQIFHPALQLVGFHVYISLKYIHKYIKLFQNFSFETAALNLKAPLKTGCFLTPLRFSGLKHRLKPRETCIFENRFQTRLSELIALILVLFQALIQV